jgi:hypothetical protein
VRLALCDPPALPVIFADAGRDTTLVDTVNGAEVIWPAATLTLDGTVATAGVSLDSVTEIPPVGAGPVNFTVPVEETPPTTLGGLKVTRANTGGLTVRIPPCVPL